MVGRASPARVGGQLGGGDLQPAVVCAAAAHCRTHVALALQGSHRRAHLTPVPQQGSDQLRAQIAGPAGHQHPAHRSTSSSSRGYRYAASSPSPGPQAWRAVTRATGSARRLASPHSGCCGSSGIGGGCGSPNAASAADMPP
jgi:hypothetical protein